MTVAVPGETALLNGWDDNTRRARYGVAYVQAICAQAGVSWTPTSADEDRRAIDGMIDLGPGSAMIQVKCSSKTLLTSASHSVALKPKWVAQWSEITLAPVYVVLVKVPKVVPDWVEHLDIGTTHHTAAFWAQFDATSHANSIAVPKSQRLTINTIHEWRRDLDLRFEAQKRGGADV